MTGNSVTIYIDRSNRSKTGIVFGHCNPVIGPYPVCVIALSLANCSSCSKNTCLSFGSVLDDQIRKVQHGQLMIWHFRDHTSLVLQWNLGHPSSPFLNSIEFWNAALYFNTTIGIDTVVDGFHTVDGSCFPVLELLTSLRELARDWVSKLFYETFCWVHFVVSYFDHDPLYSIHFSARWEGIVRCQLDWVATAWTAGTPLLSAIHKL